ncbi:MAG: beta-galactosidase [Myxococcota bacterium]
MAGARLDGATLRVGSGSLPLRSGAVHYWRQPPELWEGTLDEVVDLGLPMVETYAPWDVHEVEAGRFDFGERDPRKDLGRFLDLAHARGLKVFLRPGPHVNAELTGFGIPDRVLWDEACQARSARGNPVVLFFPPRMFPVPSYASSAFLAEVGTWYDALGEVVAPRMATRGGPVALMQVDNEAAFFFRDGPFDQDYAPEALAGWEAFALARHGDLPGAAEAHGKPYASASDIEPPRRYEADTPGARCLLVDWMAYHETLLRDALRRFRGRLDDAGMGGVPMVHNLALGEGGSPASLPALAEAVDLVGFDYYHPAHEQAAVKRRTLTLVGTSRTAFAPELGVGAPPWFTPLAHEDSLTTAIVASAYGLRGFNLYMLVDRDRWVGGAYDARGRPRAEAADWRRFLAALERTRFHALRREAQVALVMPREYRWLTRATHALGGLSPTILEALGGGAADACRGDTLGFARPIQHAWGECLSRVADALDAAALPYVYVDSGAPAERLAAYRVVVTPSFELAEPARWEALAAAEAAGAHVVYGPELPTTDARFRPHAFARIGERDPAALDDASSVHALVHEWIARFGLARPYASLPPVETTVHGDGERDVVLFAMNPSGEALEAEVRLPGPRTVVDALRGERFTGTDALRIPLEPRSARMLIVDEGDT